DVVFTDGVGRILDAIAAGRVTKVVLARHVVADYDGPIDPGAVLRRLRRLEPAATVYGLIGPDGAFVGASPELLVARHGSSVESCPRAGTVGLTGEPGTDDAAVAGLLSSPKETGEHRLVVDAIVDALAPLCIGPPTSGGPTVVRLGSVAHLATQVAGTLADDSDTLALVGALHPTPAVAGTPTPAALDLVRELEPVGRGPYAGAFGWMDAHGDGEFVVAIRGASIRGRRATVHAGAGIVAGSDADQELAETTLKLRIALSALSPAVPA
ncbi:MAG TPA: isochorismate synthase, partial [Acidimicrobiales bacterium]|nr:isochorismate synthase [Acidimicrobiales bacterium]